VTAALTGMAQHPSLVGMLIHDLKSFLALPE
jgi:hypothetical protein